MSNQELFEQWFEENYPVFAGVVKKGYMAQGLSYREAEQAMEIAEDAWQAASSTPADENSYVAWARYVRRDEWPTRIVLCGSNEEGAFKVYRQPASSTKSDVERELLEALKGLVRVNQEWNAAVQVIIGKPTGWSDQYLNAARTAIANAESEGL